MGASTERQIPLTLQPQPHDYRYDLDRALSAVVGIKANIPDGAMTAETLGTERAGNGVFIADGVALTIGYLITEAETVWLTLAHGRVVPATPLAYDQQTGFGLVQALGPVEAPVLALGDSSAARPGTRVVVGGAGGRSHSVAAAIVGKQEFAGYWEYVLDEAIFTAPAHPFWGGAALIGPSGDLLGIGSLQVGRSLEGGAAEPLNMVVPIDLLKPILDDLLTTGQANRPPRPWLGLFATEVGGTIYVAGLSTGGPADRAGLRPADAIASVAGQSVASLAGFFRRIWSLGPAGVDVPLTIERDGEQREVRVRSADRGQFLKAPRLH